MTDANCVLLSFRNENKRTFKKYFKLNHIEKSVIALHFLNTGHEY